MADTTITFLGSPVRIGLIVRGKLSATHHPDLMAQHADAILSDGSPIGFYGEGNGGSGNDVGMGMQGIVYDYNKLRQKRPYYVDMKKAVSSRVISTVLLVTVTPAQAKAFSESWAIMTRNPGNFNIAGGNCSTHASAAFLSAGILKGGIPGLDTPDRLYAQLVDKLPASSLQSLTGYIGFVPLGATGYKLEVSPYKDSPIANRPNPGSSDKLSGSADSSASS